MHFRVLTVTFRIIYLLTVLVIRPFLHPFILFYMMSCCVQVLGDVIYFPFITILFCKLVFRSADFAHLYGGDVTGVVDMLSQHCQGISWAKEQ